MRNQVIYQIFTRNYRNGTFRALEQDLPRLKELGIDYIYLLPIQPSGILHRKGSMGSPYAIQDYRTIDPVQGTMEDFIHLAESIHRAGMKLMLDVVYNHTSPDSVLSQEHPEWFYHKPDGSFGNRIGDWWDVIDLDYSHPDLWDYQISTLKIWARYADGFRCDVAPMVPLAFWQRAVAETAEVNPELIWLAESVEPEFIYSNRKSGVPTSSDAELYSAFDICYDYDIQQYLIDVLTGQGTLSDYLRQVNRQETLYPQDYSKLRFLENHDRSRAAALIPEEKILRNWTAWIYFNKGTTLIYAGQEACVSHHPTLFDPDPVCFDTGRDLSPLMKQLSVLKKDPLFSCSCFHAEAIGKNADVILAVHEASASASVPHRKAIGIFSASGRIEVLRVPLGNGTYINALTGARAEVYEGLLSYDGEPLILFL